MEHFPNLERRGLLWAMVIIASALTFGMNMSCNPKSSPNYQSIRPPVPSGDLPFEKYQLNADSGGVIVRPTGTRLRIPANAFVDETGKPVKGNVEFRVRELHNPIDLLRSGIPMSVDSTRKEVLQSAGMIELRASAGEKPLELAADKNIDVSLAGFRPSDGYSLYQLSGDRNWQVTDTFIAGPNTYKQAALDSLAVIRRYNHPDSVRFFEMAIGDLKYAPFKSLNKRTWKLGMFQSRRRFDMAMRSDWDRVRMEPVNSKGTRVKLKFSKTLSIRGTESFKDTTISYEVVAIPILKPGESAGMLSEMKSLEELNKELDVEENRARIQADLVNSFRINKMGVWNIDKLTKWNDEKEYNISFDFADRINPDKNQVELIVVFEESNAYLRFAPQDWSNVKLPVRERISMIAILPKGEVAMVSSTALTEAMSQGSSTLRLKSERMSFEQYLKKQKSPGI